MRKLFNVFLVLLLFTSTFVGILTVVPEEASATSVDSYISSNDGHINKTVYNPGISWVNYNILNESSYWNSIDTVVDSLGYIHVSYVNENLGYVGYLSNKSGVWVAENLAFFTTSFGSTGITLDENDNPIIAFRNTTSGSIKIWVAVYNGTNWNIENVVSGITPYEVDVGYSGGIIYLTYSYGYDVYVISGNLGSWITNLVYDGSTESIRIKDMEITDIGKIYIFGIIYRPDLDYEYQSVYFTNITGSWVRNDIYTAFDINGIDGFIDSDGIVHISYTRQIGGVYYYSNVTGSWAETYINSNCIEFSSSISTYNEIVNIIYTDYNGYTNYSRYNGVSWITENIRITALNYYGSVDNRFGKGGYYNNGDIYLVYCGDVGNYINIITNDQISNYVINSYYTTFSTTVMSGEMVIDNNGFLHLVYLDGVGSGYRYLIYGNNINNSWSFEKLDTGYSILRAKLTVVDNVVYIVYTGGHSGSDNNVYLRYGSNNSWTEITLTYTMASFIESIFIDSVDDIIYISYLGFVGDEYGIISLWGNESSYTYNVYDFTGHYYHYPLGMTVTSTHEIKIFCYTSYGTGIYGPLVINSSYAFSCYTNESGSWAWEVVNDEGFTYLLGTFDCYIDEYDTSYISMCGTIDPDGDGDLDSTTTQFIITDKYGSWNTIYLNVLLPIEQSNVELYSKNGYVYIGYIENNIFKFYTNESGSWSSSSLYTDTNNIGLMYNDFGVGFNNTIDDWYVIVRDTTNHQLKLLTSDTDETYGVFSSNNLNYVGNKLEENYYVNTRYYISFDTSSLDENATYTNVYFKIYMGINTGSTNVVNIYLANYDISLTTNDWNTGSTFVSSIIVTSSGWYYISILESQLNRTGLTQFEFVIDDESTITNRSLFIRSSEYVGSEPTLYMSEVTTTMVSYIMDDANIYTMDIYPEFIEYNITTRIVVLEFWVGSGVADVNITFTADWVLSSFTPYSNYSSGNNYVLLSDIQDNANYRIYLFEEVSIQSDVHFSMYLADTGEGLAFETFRIQYCLGASWNDSLSENVVSSNIKLAYGFTYTVVVKDYFSNIISQTNVVTSSTDIYHSISINVNSFKIYNQREDFIHASIYYVGAENPMSFYISPQETVEKNLKDGFYTFIVDFYENGTLNQTQYFYRNITESEYLMIAGTTISLVTGQVGELLDYQEIITELLIPNKYIVYFRYYDATGTHPGEGLEWERYLAYIDGVYQHYDQFVANINQTYELVIKDYFGNELYNSTFLANSSESTLITIPINTYSFKFMNSQDYDPVKIRVYYENSSVSHQFYLGAKEVNEKYFKPGNYTVIVVYYNGTDISDPIYFYKEVIDNSTYVNIRGYNDIDELVESVDGVIYSQQLITNYLTPDVVYFAEDLPSLPTDSYDNNFILIHPYSILHYTMNGTEYTDSEIFYYSYYTTRKYYEVTLNVSNDEAFNWENLTWFIGFPENSTINYNTVRVYDLNNDCYLTAGLHYDMTLTGIRMTWDSFNTSLSRAFKISFYDQNVSAPSGIPIATTDEYEVKQYSGENYYMSTVSWTNDYASRYQGAFSIKLNFDKAQYIDYSSIIVIDKKTNKILEFDTYTIAGNTITIGYVDIPVGSVASYDIYFHIDHEEAQKMNIFSPLVDFAGLIITPAILMVVGFFAILLWAFLPKPDERKILVLGIYGSVVVVMFALYFYTNGVV